MYPTPCSLAKFDLSRALPALVLRWFGNAGDVGMIAEVFAEGAAENAHARAMNDPNARKAGKEGAVEEPFDFGLSFIGGAADHIDL
jgi:hypothetical protein